MSRSKETKECLGNIFCDVLNLMKEEMKNDIVDKIKCAESIGKGKAYHDVLEIITFYIENEK